MTKTFTIRVTQPRVRWWRASPGLTDVVMTPANGVTVRPGVNRVLSVTESKDEDEYSDDGGQTWHRNDAEDKQGTTYRWSCEQPEFGDFVADPNPSPLRAIWRPKPTDEVRHVTIICTIDDDQNPGVEAPDEGTRDDMPPLKKYFYLTVKPAVDAVASYTGKTRICAGGVLDNYLDTAGLHQTTLTLRFRDPATNAPVADEPVKIVLAENGAAVPSQGPDKLLARQAKIITPGFYGNADDQPTAWETQTDGGGVVEVRILSSQVIGNADVIALHEGNAVEFYEPPATTGPPAITVSFAAAQGARRRGIVFFNQGSTRDNGFEFLPVNPTGPVVGDIAPGKGVGALVFQRAGDIIKVQYSLKFYDQSYDPGRPVDTNYFLRGPVANNLRVDTVDTDSNGVISKTELESHTARTSLDDDANWKPVGGHRIRFKIVQLYRGDNGTPLSSFTFRHIYYCDDQGQPVDSYGSLLPVPQNTFPPFREVSTDANGVATFYIRAGLQWADFHTARIIPFEFEQRK